MRNRKKIGMMPQYSSFQIEFCSDSKGYFDRKCPKCGLNFGIKQSDYKFHQGNMYCPMCGFSLPYNADKWFTDRQVSEINTRIRAFASELISKQFDSIFSRLNRTSRSNKNLITVSYKQERRPVFKNAPVLQPKEWDIEVTCPKCGKHYSVIGSAFFCPFCGENNIEDIFEKSLVVIRYKLNFEKVFSHDLAMMPKNVAIDFTRSILESCVSEVVSTFQKFAETRLKKFTQEKMRVNDFQIINKGSLLYKTHTGHSYLDFISEKEYEFLNLMFKRRHLLEHNMGIVDAKYIAETNDFSVKNGQRIIISKKEVSDFVDVVEKLGLGIKGI